jgi:glycosyltransferase involved in cell wall biosynthesis
MKIVFVTEWFSENMGYIENCLPVALQKLGHEVHIVSTTQNVYANQTKLYEKTYRSFLGPALTPTGTKTLDGGVQLHRLDFVKIPGYKSKFMFLGINRKLLALKPDILHVFDPFSFQHPTFLLHKMLSGYRIFTAQHSMLSVFPLDKKWDKGMSFEKFAWLLTQKIPGTFAAKYTELCYPTTPDAAYIAMKYFGVPKEKCHIAPLGVDTDTFRPNLTEEDEKQSKILRGLSGYTDKDIVCIYTGRFSEGKNPLILAKAIDKLASINPKFKGLFIGEGEQFETIERLKNCKVIKFLSHIELPPYYRMADIGVWPTQESTSMLDAAASGLPIIVNNTIKATERVEGNGLMYELENVDDLVQKLQALEDASLRETLGKNGMDKIKSLYSWDRIALERQADYLKKRKYIRT